MGLVSKALFVIVACLGLAFLSEVLSAGQKTCTQSDEKQALDESDGLNDWNALHRNFIRFAQCDDGAVAEGYSDAIGRLLVHDW